MNTNYGVPDPRKSVVGQHSKVTALQTACFYKAAFCEATPWFAEAPCDQVWIMERLRFCLAALIAQRCCHIMSPGWCLTLGHSSLVQRIAYWQSWGALEVPESFPSAGSLIEVPPILLRVFVRDFFFFSNFCRSYNTLFYPPVWQSFIWAWFCWLKLEHQAKPLIFTYCCSRLMIIMIFTVHSQQTCKSCTICAKRRNVIWLCLPCICRVF